MLKDLAMEPKEPCNCCICNREKINESDNQIVDITISLRICKPCIEIVKGKMKSPLSLINLLTAIDLNKIKITGL